MYKVRDMIGREVTVENNVTYVVVFFSPQVLEILHALGVSDYVVAIDTYLKHSIIFEDPLLPRFLNINAIQSINAAKCSQLDTLLKPHLIIMDICNKNQKIARECLKVLESKGIPVYATCSTMNSKNDLEKWYEVIESFGVVFQCVERAKDVIHYLKSLIYMIYSTLNNVSHHPRFILSFNKPTLIAGKKCFCAVLGEMVGGVNIGNVIDDVHVEVKPEFISDANPEVWIVWAGMQKTIEEIYKTFSGVEAIKKNNVFQMPWLGCAKSPLRAHLYIAWYASIFYPTKTHSFNEVIDEFIYRLYEIPRWKL